MTDLRAELRECILQLHEAMLAEVAKDEINADYLLRLMATALCQLLASKVTEMDERPESRSTLTGNPSQLHLFDPPDPD